VVADAALGCTEDWGRVSEHIELANESAVVRFGCGIAQVNRVAASATAMCGSATQ
jgi:hypothetical protein